MFCNNCGKDIGTQTECSFCGYNPKLDNGTKTAISFQAVQLPQTKIKLLKKSNGMAIAGLVMSILSFYPIPFMMLAFVFNCIGTARCKSYRSGKGKCITAWLFLALWILVYAAIIYYVIVSNKI